MTKVKSLKNVRILAYLIVSLFLLLGMNLSIVASSMVSQPRDWLNPNDEVERSNMPLLNQNLVSHQQADLFDSLEIIVKDDGQVEMNYRLFRSSIYLPVLDHSRMSQEVKSSLLVAELSASEKGVGPFNAPGMLTLVFNVSDENVALSRGNQFVSSVLGMDVTLTSLFLVSKIHRSPYFGHSIPQTGATVVFYSLNDVNILQYRELVKNALNEHSNGVGREIASQFYRVDQVTFLVWRYGSNLEDFVQGVGVKLFSQVDQISGTHHLSVVNLLQLSEQLVVDATYLNVTITLPRVDPSTMTSVPTPLAQGFITPDERRLYLESSPDDYYYRLQYSLTQTIPDLTVTFDYTFHPRYLDDWAEVGIFVSPLGTATRRLVFRGENATISSDILNELQTNSMYDGIRAVILTNEFINNTLTNGSYKIPFFPMPGFYFFQVDVYLDQQVGNVTIVENFARFLNQTLFGGNTTFSIDFAGNTVINIDDREFSVLDYKIGIQGDTTPDEAFNLTRKLVNSPAWNMSDLIRSTSFRYGEKGYYSLVNAFYHVPDVFTTESYWGAELTITWPTVDLFNGPSTYQPWPLGQRENQVIPEDIYGFNDLNLTNGNLRGITLNVLVPVEREGASSLNVPLGNHQNYTAVKGFFPAPRGTHPNARQLENYFLYLYQAVFDVDFEWYWINVLSEHPRYLDGHNVTVPIDQFVITFNHTIQPPSSKVQLPLPLTIGFIGDSLTPNLISTSSHVGIFSHRNDSKVVYFGLTDHQQEVFNGTETLVFLIMDDYGVYLNGSTVTYPSDVFGLADNWGWNHWITSSGIRDVTITFSYDGVPLLGGNFLASAFTNSPFHYNGTDVIFWNHVYSWNGTSWRDLDPGAPPFVAHALSYEWNTSLFADGYWQITVNATNNDGKWATRTFKVLVDNYPDRTTQAPSITILSSSDLQPNAVVRTSQPVLRYQVNDDVGIFGLYLTIDNQSYLLDPDVTEFAWDASATWEGQHVISLTAIDREGQNATVTFIVHLDKGADPVVEVLSPPNNTVLDAGEIVNFTVRATDDRGVASVQLSIDNGTAEFLSTNDGVHYSRMLSADLLGDGNHELMVTVTDVDMYTHVVTVRWILIVNGSVIPTQPASSNGTNLTTTLSSSVTSSPSSSVSTSSLSFFMTVIALVIISTIPTTLRRRKHQ